MRYFVLIFVFLLSACFGEKESSKVYVCPMHPQIVESEPGECPICGMDLVIKHNHSTDKTKSKDVINDHESHDHSHNIYTCPMHPQIVQDEPGSCPICGMDLLKKESTGESSHKENEQTTEVVLSSTKKQLIGVKTAKAKQHTLFKDLVLPGRVAFDPELYTAMSEYMEALKQWKRIKDSPLKAVKKSTQEMIRSSKVRLQVLGLSETQINELSKNSNLESFLISGSGQNNWIYADVFESDLNSIEKGQSAKVTASSNLGQSFNAKVLSVDQVINRNTRTAKVRLKITDKKVSLRPESYVRVEIKINLGEHLSVPKSAVFDTGLHQYIYHEYQQGHYALKPVKVILEASDYVAITGDIKEGDVIAVDSQFLIDSEARLNATIEESL